jgi:EmrB/QacA subfamily drug resistance transporter
MSRPYPRRWQALIVLAFSLLVITVGNTILNVAIPTIQQELGASSSELQWIVDGYMLLYAGLLLAAGSLGDRFGRRRALVTGLILFGIGSGLAALCTTSGELIACRALMGIGAAGIMPTTLSVITNIFPADERPRAIAVWAAVAGLGIAVGPIAGGWMIEHFSWNAIFLFNLPAVAACLIGAFALVPESRDPSSPKLDVVGAALSVLALTALVWALIEAPDRGWTAPAILGAFATGGAVAGAFVWWERRVAEPMLEVGVFRNLRFSAASLSITFVYFALMGVMYFLTTYLQSVLGLSALGAGVRMLPIAAGMVVASRVSVALTARCGTKVSVASGLAVVAVALGLLAGFDEATGDLQISLVLALMGAGIGLAMSPATEAIMGSLPKERAGVGSAMNDVVREVAGTLGVAVLGSILAAGYASGMDGQVDGLSGSAAAAASDSVGAAHEVAAQAGGSAGSGLVAAADHAFVHAMGTTATVAAGVALCGAVIAAVFLPARAARRERAADGYAPVATQALASSSSAVG